MSPLPRCASAEKVHLALALPVLTAPVREPNAQCASASVWYSPASPRTPALKSCSQPTEPPPPPLAPVRVEPLALKIRLSADGADAGAGGVGAVSTAQTGRERQAAARATRGEYRNGLIVSSEVRRPADGRRGWGHRAS